jgi:hypothetical protein
MTKQDKDRLNKLKSRLADEKVVKLDRRISHERITYLENEIKEITNKYKQQ